MSTLTTDTEMITPDLAALYLVRNCCNRSLSAPHVGKLKRSMLHGEFRHTHQGIAFDEHGQLVDGQHRLKAIIESGLSFPMQVTRGLAVASRSLIDNQSRPRSVCDALVMEGNEIATKSTVAICRMWLELLGNQKPALHEIREFLREHSESIRFAAAEANGTNTLKHACVSTMLSVGHEAGYSEQLSAWCEVVRTGLASHDWQTSALRFRDWWFSVPHAGGRDHRIETCRRVFTSMSAWVEKRPLQKLYAKQSIDWLSRKAVTGK